MKKNILLIIFSVFFSVFINAVDNPDIVATELSQQYPSYSVDHINKFIKKETNRYLNESQIKKLFFKKTVFDRTEKQLSKISQPVLKAKLNYMLGTLSTEVLIGENRRIADYFKNTIQYNPNFENRDVALYNYAYYNLQAVKDEIYDKRMNLLAESTEPVWTFPIEMRLTKDKLQGSIDAYSQISEESELHGESLYRLGMLYFELVVDASDTEIKKQYIEKASSYFETLSNSSDSKFKVLSVFQKGWTAFSKNQYEDAIANFEQVLKMIQGNEELTAQIQADAISVLSFSLLEEYDGSDYLKESDAAKQVKDELAGKFDKNVISEIIKESIRLKRSYGAPSQIIDFYDTLVQLYPSDISAPTYIDSIITITKDFGFDLRENFEYGINQQAQIDANVERLVLNQYERLVNFYNTNSVWYQDNKEKNISSQLDLILEAFEGLYPRYRKPIANTINEGVLSKEDFLRFEELSKNFLKFDSFDEKSDRIDKQDIQLILAYGSLNIANNEMNIDNVTDAISRINTYKENYLASDNTEILMDNRYFLVNDFYNKLAEEADAQTPEDIRNNPVDSLFIAESKVYENFLKVKYPELTGVEQTVINLIWERGSIYYNSDRKDLAAEDYKSLLDLSIEDGLRSEIYQLLASMNYEDGNYQIANMYFKKQMELASDETKESISENIKNTTIKLAQSQLEGNDFMAAAQSYLSLNTTEAKAEAAKIYFENGEYILAAKYFLELDTFDTVINAAVCYEKANDYQKAIDLWLDVSNRENEYDEKLKYYQKAWVITDSLQEYSQSIDLRRRFINLDPFKNKANMQKYYIISIYYEGNKLAEYDSLASKEMAAEKYLELYEELKRARIEEISFPQVDMPISNIYFTAVGLLEEIGQEERSISLMTQFELENPNNKEIKQYLRKILPSKYKQSGREEKYVELIEKLFRESPKDTLRTVNEEGNTILITALGEFKKIANNELRVINDNINSLYNNRNLRDLKREVSEFRRVFREYNQKGLELNFDFLFQQYDFYTKYLTYLPTYQRSMNNLDKAIEEDTFFKNFRVVRTSKIEKNIVNREIPQLQRAANQEVDRNLKILEKRNEMFAEAQELGINVYELSASDLAKVYYTNARIYEYAVDVIDRGMEEYFASSIEFDKIRKALEERDPDKLATIANQINTLVNKEKIKLRRLNNEDPYHSSIGSYSIVFQNFYKKGIYNQWAYKTVLDFKDMNIPPFRNYDVINDTSSVSWKNNIAEVNNLTEELQNPDSWGALFSANMNENNPINNQSYEIILTEFDAYIDPQINFKGPNEVVMVDYVLNKPLDIFVNENLIEAQTHVVDSIAIGNELYTHYNSFITPQDLNNLQNRIIFKVKADTVGTKQTYFKAQISTLFDQSKRIEYFGGTDKIVTDENWLVSKDFSSTNVTPDSSWSNVSTINDSILYSKIVNQFIGDPKFISLNTSEANVDTVIFAKSFELPVELNNLKIRFIGNGITLLVNNQEIVATSPVQFDYNSATIEPLVFDIPKLKSGENQIIVKQISPLNESKIVIELLLDPKEVE